MKRSSGEEPLTWWELVLLALLGLGLIVGLAANGQSLLQSLISIGFLAGFLLFAWLWKVTIQEAKPASSLTPGRRAMGAVLLFALLAVMAGLAWWYVNRERNPVTPAGSKPPLLENQVEDVADPCRIPAR